MVGLQQQCHKYYFNIKANYYFKLQSKYSLISSDMLGAFFGSVIALRTAPV